VNWHLNLASKNSKSSEVEVRKAKNTPLVSATEEMAVIDTENSVYNLSAIDTIGNIEPIIRVQKDQEPTEKIALSKINEVNHSPKSIRELNSPLQKSKLIENLSAHLPRRLNQEAPKNEDRFLRKGGWSFVSGLGVWISLLFAGFTILLYGPDLLLATFIILGSACAIAAIIFGVMTIISPQDKRDLVFGALGTVLGLLPILLVIAALFFL
jgi:hypothetical protein